MFRTYLATALLGLGLFSYAQYRGWSIMPSEAEEFQRRKAAQAYYGPGRVGSGSSYSGHK